MKVPIDAVLSEFHSKGFALIPGALSEEQVEKLRKAADSYLDNPESLAPGFIDSVYGTPVLRNTQSLDPVFCDLLGQEPFVSLSEALLGSDFGFCGQNVIRSGKGEAISRWHVDDVLEFPLPDDVPHHNRDIHMPVNWFSFQIALSDIETPDDGATEVIPGSHYSGRVPPGQRMEADEDNPPSFEGIFPEPILCRAGDVYLFNHQLWHRGRPNLTGRTRYLMQSQYCQGWLLRRFGPGPHRECHLPSDMLESVSPVARRILGINKEGE
jgi:hypothetical protein